MSWEIDPDANYEPPAIARSVYNLKIVKAEEKAPEAGGVQVRTTVKILDGEFKDRQQMIIYSVVHANPQAQQIAQTELQKLWKGVGGEGKLKSAGQLQGKKFKAEFGPQKPGADFYKFFDFPGDDDEAETPDASDDDEAPF